MLSEAPNLRLRGVNVDFTPIMEARAEIESADRQKDAFLAVLGCELSNPMAPIVNAAELLARADECEVIRRNAVDFIQLQARQSPAWSTLCSSFRGCATALSRSSWGSSISGRWSSRHVRSAPLLPSRTEELM